MNRPPTRRDTIGALLIALSNWQRVAVEDWRAASNAMNRLHTAITQLGSTLPVSDFGLIVVPDRVGPVPFARNANGALLMPYTGDRERGSQLVIATEHTLPDWFRLSQQSIVKKLTPRADVPDAPTRFFCFDGKALIALGFWKSANQGDWDRSWQTALRAHCQQSMFP
jgi:hypothetical protein